MSFPELSQLPRPELLQAMRDAAAVRLREEGVGLGETEEGLNQGTAVPMMARVDAMGPGEFAENIFRESGKRLLDRAGRADSSGGITRSRGALNIALAGSCAGRPISPQDLDRPLRLSELMRVSSRVRMESAGPRAIRLFDCRQGGPSATEPRRMDPDVFEPEDAERGIDPFRLQIELPQV